jgi:hypothetical protein
VVNMLACFTYIRTRGCGCTWHPAFPAPFSIGRTRNSCKTRARGAARSWRRVQSILLLSSPRARSAWWGGVGGGGCFGKFAGSLTRGTTPTPPRNAQARIEGGEKNSLFENSYQHTRRRPGLRAGTHNHKCPCCAMPERQSHRQLPQVVMGPSVRRDDEFTCPTPRSPRRPRA